MLFLRNNTTMPLFLFRVRTSQSYSDQAITNAIAFDSTVQDLPLRAVQNWFVFVTISFFSDGSHEKKSCSENKNSINMEIL